MASKYPGSTGNGDAKANNNDVEPGSGIFHGKPTDSMMMLYNSQHNSALQSEINLEREEDQ